MIKDWLQINHWYICDLSETYEEAIILKKGQNNAKFINLLPEQSVSVADPITWLKPQKYQELTFTLALVE